MGVKFAKRPRKDFVGLRFGRLTVIAEDAPRKNTYGSPIRWLVCACDCGEIKSINALRLNSGKTKSCGCLHRDTCRAMLTTHGKRHSSPSYTSWTGMRYRCYSPSNAKYPIYGGRGIKVCDRWLESFENFLADMGEKPEGMTLDRIDPNGNYEPENCRWATPAQQANNLRTVRYLEHNGARHTITEWASILGTTRPAIIMRMRRGETISEIAAAFGR